MKSPQKKESPPSEKLVLLTMRVSDSREQSKKNFRAFLEKLGVEIIKDEPTP